MKPHPPRPAGVQSEPARIAAPALAARRRTLLALVALLVGGFTALRLWMAARVGLGDVEAYYWTWAQQPLAPSYFDHGPLVARLIQAGTALLRDTTLGVRLGFVLLSAATLGLLATLPVRIAGSDPAGSGAAGASDPAPAFRAEAALWTVAVALAMPMFLVAGAAANPDGPFVFLVLLQLHLLARVHRAAAASRPKVVRLWLLCAALCGGLSACAKYFGLALVLPLLVAARRCGSRLIFQVTLTGLFLVPLVPVVWWNWQQGWPSVQYHLVARHSQPVGPSLVNLGKLLGGQLGYVSPLLLLGLGAALLHLWRRRGRDGWVDTRLAAALGLLLPGYSLILVVPGAEPHWPAAGYLPLVPLLGALLPGWWRASRRVRVLTVIAAVFSAVVALGFHLHLLTDLGVRLMPPGYVPRYDLSNELRGWPKVVDAVARAAAEQPPGRSTVAAGCHYTSCAQLAFAARGRFEVACPSPRRDQFDFGPRGGDGSTWARGSDLIYVLDERFPFDAALLYRCAGGIRALEEVRIHRGGRLVRRFRLQLCRNFAGLRATHWPPR